MKKEGKVNKQQEKISKELFEMAYSWGRFGVITDHRCNAWRKTIKELLNIPPLSS